LAGCGKDACLMADTGNPWFIPFAEPSDLVRDWPALSSAVGTAVAAGLTAAGNAGIGSNVVQAVKLDHFTVTSTTPTIPTGLSVSITPTSDTSKVLVIAHIVYGYATAGQVPFINLLRDSTAIFVGTGGSSVNATYTPWNIASASEAVSVTLTYLDSPATTSAVVYAPGVASNTGAIYVNRSGNTDQGGSSSSIIAIEVAV
jgi:hypothetical protein